MYNKFFDFSIKRSYLQQVFEKDSQDIGYDITVFFLDKSFLFWLFLYIALVMIILLTFLNTFFVGDYDVLINLGDKESADGG